MLAYVGMLSERPKPWPLQQEREHRILHGLAEQGESGALLWTSTDRCCCKTLCGWTQTAETVVTAWDMVTQAMGRSYSLGQGPRAGPL